MCICLADLIFIYLQLILSRAKCINQTLIYLQMYLQHVYSPVTFNLHFQQWGNIFSLTLNVCAFQQCFTLHIFHLCVFLFPTFLEDCIIWNTLADSQPLVLEWAIISMLMTGCNDCEQKVMEGQLSHQPRVRRTTQ